MNSGNGCEVIFHRLASKEYLKARRWYDKEGGEQLAERFCGEVAEAVDQIADNPASWPIFRMEYRFVRLSRFPYVVYYHVLDATRVIVLAVAHAARRPGYWLRRAKKH